ncbi:hypothetical protein GW17_00018359 [Ensete ventricosum]|nr:hypothetical protein GW17_00018359 [Ensete ventricosum]
MTSREKKKKKRVEHTKAELQWLLLLCHSKVLRETGHGPVTSASRGRLVSGAGDGGLATPRMVMPTAHLRSLRQRLPHPTAAALLPLFPGHEHMPLVLHGIVCPPREKPRYKRPFVPINPVGGDKLLLFFLTEGCLKAARFYLSPSIHSPLPWFTRYTGLFRDRYVSGAVGLAPCPSSKSRKAGNQNTKKRTRKNRQRNRGSRSCRRISLYFCRRRCRSNCPCLVRQSHPISCFHCGIDSIRFGLERETTAIHETAHASFLRPCDLPATHSSYNLYKRAAKTGVGVSSPSISIPQSQKRDLERSWQRFDTRNRRRILLLRLLPTPAVLRAAFVDDKVECFPLLSTTVSGPFDYLAACK